MYFSIYLFIYRSIYLYIYLSIYLSIYLFEAGKDMIIGLYFVISASRWGCEADVCGKGQGPQEEFYGCSDIAIAPPNQYTTYLHLVTPPTESSPVAYDVPSTNYDHMHDHDAHMKVVIKEIHEPGNAEQPSRSKLPNLSFKRPRTKVLARPNNMPEAKVFFTAQRLSGRQAVKHNLNNVLQRIMIDTYRKYDQRSDYKVNVLVSDRECLPTVRFSDNPIILEWCIRGCPGLNRECPPNMCSCKQNFKQNDEVLIPFMDLALYKSELRNKVPFELTNSFTGMKMYDGLVSNSLNEGPMLGRFGTDSGNSIRNSFPKHMEHGNRFRNGKSDIWNIWKSSPYNKQIDTRKELIRFPIKTRSISQIYKQPFRTYIRRRELPAPNIKLSTPLPHTQLPLESIQKFVPKEPFVKGLSFFSKSRGPRVPSIFDGKSVNKYTSSTVSTQRNRPSTFCAAKNTRSSI